MDPTAAGTPTPGGSELTPEQMRSNLQDLMSKIDGKYQDFKSQKFAGSAKEQDIKSSVLRQLFDLFVSKGVDPNSPGEVKAFLDNIKRVNPELYQQVEQALMMLINDGSLGADEQGAPTGPTDAMGMPQGLTGDVQGINASVPPLPPTAPAIPTNMNINPNAAPSQNL
jgi:DNA-binding TFAR19-related protein (PDSD5 family)